MRLGLVSLFVVMLPLPVWADLTIFDVRQNLPMSATDPVYRDFIINGGTEAGLSVGMVVTVQRKLPLYDSYQNRSAGDLQLKVAKIKIIHVQRGMAVARLQTEFTRESTPILEDNFIMIGDRLDMASATSGGGGGDKKADNSTSSTTSASNASPAAGVAPSATTASSLTVNSVLLSSQSAPQPKDTPPPGSAKVDVQVLQ